MRRSSGKPRRQLPGWRGTRAPAGAERELEEDKSRRPAEDAEKQPGKITLDKAGREEPEVDPNKLLQDEDLDEKTLRKAKAAAAGEDGAKEEGRRAEPAGGVSDEELAEDMSRRPAQDAEKQPGKIKLDKKPGEEKPDEVIFKDEPLDEERVPKAAAADAPAPDLDAAIAEDMSRRPELDAEKQPSKIELEKPPAPAVEVAKLLKDEVLDERMMALAGLAGGPDQAAAPAELEPHPPAPQPAADAEAAAAAFGAAKSAAAKAGGGAGDASGLAIVDMGAASAAASAAAKAGAGGDASLSAAEVRIFVESGQCMRFVVMSACALDCQIHVLHGLRCRMRVSVQVARVERHRKRRDRLRDRLAARERAMDMGEPGANADDTERQRLKASARASPSGP